MSVLPRLCFFCHSSSTKSIIEDGFTVALSGAAAGQLCTKQVKLCVIEEARLARISGYHIVEIVSSSARPLLVAVCHNHIFQIMIPDRKIEISLEIYGMKRIEQSMFFLLRSIVVMEHFIIVQLYKHKLHVNQNQDQR